MKLAWLTEIYLNFLRPPALEPFLDSLAETEAEPSRSAAISPKPMTWRST